MTIKALKEMMVMLYENDPESYDDLWNAVKTLVNLGLIDRKFSKAMVEEDRKLFEGGNENDD